MPVDLSRKTEYPRFLPTLCLGAGLFFLIANFFPKPITARQTSQTPVEETVANFAAGRVILAVVKDAIIVGTIENPIEPETRPPTPVALGTARVGILLGPVYWFSPSSQQELASLDTELPHLRSEPTLGAAPHLQVNQGGTEASDIEATGQGLLDRLNAIAKNLRAKVDAPSNQPLAELIVADYLPGYGPEVWQLTYQMKQIEEERDYWETHFLRPNYIQFWPPEKGQPKTLVEFDYPLENSPAPVLELLRQKDDHLNSVYEANPSMAGVSDLFLRGESDKIASSDAVPFLRAVMSAVAKPGTRQTLAVIREDSGIEWVIPPPPEPRKPQPVQQAGQSGQSEDRPADAPSLLHPSR